MTADITSLRIATFNLLHGLDVRSNRVDLDAVAEAIDKLDADVVAGPDGPRLQEEPTGGLPRIVTFGLRFRIR